MSAFEAELMARFGARLRCGQPLAALTSFRIGGPGDFVVEVADENDLSAARRPPGVSGPGLLSWSAGTNILVSDRGMRGLVLLLSGSFDQIHFDGCHVRAGAAAQFGGLVAQAVARGLSGLEFGEGIPGSVGGALIMNAGAFGGEMAPVVSAVRGADPDGRIRTLARDEVDFLYRRSILPPGFIVSAVEFDLIPGDRKVWPRRLRSLKPSVLRANHRACPMPARFSKILPAISPDACWSDADSRASASATPRFRSSMRTLSSISVARGPSKCAS